MAYIDRMIDIQLAFGYDVGKGFVTGEQEVCLLLPQLVDNKQIQETLNTRLETDRLTVTRQLGLLQRDRPWTAITVKTRQATTSTLNIMILDAMQLKEEGDEPKGVYILVSGLLEATYTPPDDDIDESIPNYEFLTDLKFNEPSQDYIVSGNAVGVLGVLTNRPYSYTVRCDSAVQAYHITMPIIKEAFNLAPHPIMGLEAAMWREIGIKLAMMVLPMVPAYHGWSVERLSIRLEHAFVPCLKAFKIFVVNELMEDIVLLDGICQDMATREVFQPPCYIPRTAHRLIFPKSSQLVASSACPETKLLIVPAKDTDELDIMEEEINDVQCELVSNASSRCLYHRVVHKLSCESRTTSRRGIARGKRRRGGPLRRVNYRDSIWSRQISSPALEAGQSEKELSSKYYKPNLDEVSEKLDPTKAKNDMKTLNTITENLQESPSNSIRNNMRFESEEEIFNTVLMKVKKNSLDKTK